MYLKDSKIIVIKIGSSLLIDDYKKKKKKWLSEFAKDIQELIKQNKKVIIVSSGAIAMGCKKLNLSKKNLNLDKSQAVASIGQIELMNLFSQTFFKMLRALKGFIFDIFRLFSTFRVRARSKSRKNVGILLQNQ